IAPVKRLGLLGGVLARPRRVNLLLENDHRSLGDRAAHALIAIDRRRGGTIAGNRQHMKLAVGGECFFSSAALDQRARGQIAGVLRLRLQRAEPALILAARRSDAATTGIEL